MVRYCDIYLLRRFFCSRVPLVQRVQSAHQAMVDMMDYRDILGIKEDQDNKEKRSALCYCSVMLLHANIQLQLWYISCLHCNGYSTNCCTRESKEFVDFLGGQVSVVLWDRLAHMEQKDHLGGMGER